MKRRTLDLAFGFGGLVFSLVLLVVGLILSNQADFAKGYVKDQLTAQQITFTPADALKGEQDDAPCLVDFGGQILDTGKKAECYANEYIAYHLANSATEAGYEGATYATLGTPQRQLRADLQAAVDAGDPTEAVQADLDAVNSLRDTMFKGETLRGLLLTTYGFSIFGDRAAAAALVLLIGFVVLLALSLAGLVHAFGLAKSQQMIVPT
ncbi:MAG: hypothetical protein AAB131_17130 [Actinomycetota bacterium]|jgi:hypothetical protein|nr:MAG: hypothetical protein FD127_1897 [Acidimicrobiaceae bacterium]